MELIHRENRRFTLTPAGEYFYRQSRTLLDEVDELQRETIRIGQAEESRLRWSPYPPGSWRPGTASGCPIYKTWLIRIKHQVYASII